MKTKWMSWTNGILGLLLLIAPFTFGYSGLRAAFWNSMVIGILIAAFSFWEAFNVESSGVSSILSVLGIWTIFAPYLLGYAAIRSAFWINLIIGLIVAVLAGYQAMQTSRRLVPHERH